MSKMSLTEATILALQNKLSLNEGKMSEIAMEKEQNNAIAEQGSIHNKRTNSYTKSTNEYDKLRQEAKTSGEDKLRLDIYNMIINDSERLNKKIAFNDVQTLGNIIVNTMSDYFSGNLKLENKLVEKENPVNREINAKLRSADKYIDELRNKYHFGVFIDTTKELPEKYKYATDEPVDIDSQEEYDNLVKEYGKDNVQLLVSLGSLSQDAGPAYNVSTGEYHAQDGYSSSDIVNKDTDIATFLDKRWDRNENEANGNYSGYDYRNNAKHSEDSLGDGTPRLRDTVKDELDKYKTNKQAQKDLSKELDQLQKTNTRDEKNRGKFKNDEKIIAKTQQLNKANDVVKKLSKDDGSFDTEGVRDSIKNSQWSGLKTI